jgi:SAM-dependent methyltransferase
MPSPTTSADQWIDFLQSEASGREFPVSTMSKTLAHVIDQLAAPAEGEPTYALDVGTGTGIHAFILYGKGFPVVATDCNEEAVQLAYRHASKAGIQCQKVDQGKLAAAVKSSRKFPREIVFATVPLQDLANQVGTGIKFSPITFNPPGFFFLENTDRSSPVAVGVYASPVSQALDRGASLLFQFFDQVVFPLLKPGGDVICTWPGLERRVVELSPAVEIRGNVEHPADLLEHWFEDVRVTCEDKRTDPFYRRLASIEFDYGLGDSFWRNLEEGLRDPRCYSRLVTAADGRMGGRTTFRFGVLHLRRLTSAKQFEVIGAKGE